jgi:outer membrane autotransporter protein
MVNTPGVAAATVIDQLFVADATGPIPRLFAANGITGDVAISKAVSQTLPLLTGDSVVATSGALSGINRVVQARIESNSGLSSGDSFAGDKNVWMKPFGSAANQDDSGAVSGFKARVYGLAGGIDGTLSNTTRLGVAVAIANATVDSNSATAPQTSKVDVFQLIGYGSTSLDASTELSYQADIGNSSNKGRRDLSSFSVVADSNYKSLSLHAGVGLGRSYPVNQTTSFTPSVRVDYTQVKDDSYTETGAGALNLVVDGRSSEQLIYALDGKVSHKLSPATTLNINLGVAYDAKAKQSSITAAYAGAPGLAFTTTGMDVNATTYRLGVGVVNKDAQGLEITGRYDLEGRSGFANQTLSAKVRWVF